MCEILNLASPHHPRSTDSYAHKSKKKMFSSSNKTKSKVKITFTFSFRAIENLPGGYRRTNTHYDEYFIIFISIMGYFTNIYCSTLCCCCVFS